MAGLESCPTCGNQTSENAGQCPACGEPLSPGWADAVREKREQEAEEAKRAVAQAALARKKAERKKRLVWVSILAVLIVSVYGKGSLQELFSFQMYTVDDYYQQNLKEIDPVEYQRRVQQLEEPKAAKARAKAEAKAAEERKTAAAGAEKKT